MLLGMAESLPPVKADASRTTSPFTHVRLSEALGRVKLEVKGLGTDITHGTEFFVPVVTLLAGLLGTRRQDVVYSQWPILGCPVRYYHETLPKRAVRALEDWQKMHLKPARLWEIIDLLQSHYKWELKDLIEWVRAVESAMYGKQDIMVMLQAAADEARRRHDAEGMSENPPEMSEGIVIPVPESRLIQ
jgi:hypothetical protein